MMIILSLILLVILIACVGFLYTEGLWSNALRLVNVVTAGLLAFNFFEPVARWLTGLAPSFVLLWDYLALWALFVIFLVVFRLITDRVSRVQLRFLKIVDQVGGGVFAFVIGWVMICFTLATFHTAPLAKNFLFGAFQPNESMFFGVVAPDRQWLWLVQHLSDGAYCRSAPGAFDREHYIDAQARRREQIGVYVQQVGALRINPDAVGKGSVPVTPSP